MRALVIPSEVEESRGITERQIRGILSTPLRFAQDEACSRTNAVD